MTPERNRFEIGWVMVSPRWDDAGMARGWHWDGAGMARGLLGAATQCLIFTARGFFIGQMLVANDFISIFVD